MVLVVTATGLWAAGVEEELATAADKKYVTDPTTGKVVTAPEYGGTFTYASKEGHKNPDIVLSGFWGKLFISGVLEKLSITNWGIDRAEWDFAGSEAPLFALNGALAEGWEMPDDKTVIVKVRQGVHWHDKPPMNGRELTAHDIEYNFHRLMGLGSGFTEPSTYTFGLKNLSFESITATDESTVVFSLKQPNLGTLISILDDRLAWIYPPEVIEEHGDAGDWRNLVGTGPFMLTDWVEGSSLTWTKNPDYWGYDEKYPQNRLPYVDEIRALNMQEQATYVAAMRSGKIDYMGLAGGTNFSSLDLAESLRRTNPEIEQWSVFLCSCTSTGLNVSKPPFDDIRVRKAMQMALDLETFNDTYFKGYAITTPYGQVGPAVPGYFVPFEEWPEDLKKVFDYDPEGAEALLDAAGYPRDADGIRFKTAYMHLDSFPVSFIELLAAYWSDIGVDVEIDVVPLAPFVERRADRDFEMGKHEMAYGSLSNPGSIPLRYVSTAPFNSAAVDDPVYDAMYEAAQAATTIEEQQRLVKELDMYSIENHWAVYGAMSPFLDATQPWVVGFGGEGPMASLQANEVFARIWIDQDLKEAMGY